MSSSARGVGWRTVRSLDTASRSRGPLSSASDTAFFTTDAEYSRHRSSSRLRMNSSGSSLSKYSWRATPTWCLNSHSVSIGPYTALEVAGSYPRGADEAAAAGSNAAPEPFGAPPGAEEVPGCELRMYLPCSTSS
jgi:hypothetical protein